MLQLPGLGFGTDGYPSVIARRLRVLNIATWMAAALMAGFAIAEVIFGSAEALWLAGAYATAAVPLAMIPLLHRFGPFAAPLGFAVTGYTTIFVICSAVGTDAGVSMQYLVAAAIIVLILGAEHWLASAALTMVAAGLAIWLELSVPADTGLLSPMHMAISLTANVAGSATILFTIVLYSLRDTARAEARAEREYDRSEQLLNSILPGSIARRLKAAPGSTIVDRYDQASVLFADMAGFTARASEVPAEHLVECLNRVFGEFDRLVARHGLEKVKSSGDAYMVVSGIPVPRSDHAEALADFAIEMRELAKVLPNSIGEPTAIRIGIASGPLVAGVIGSEKMFYDVWGDTVNVASRMETACPEGEIHLSPETALALQDDFDLEAIAPQEIKGKGMMATWLLRGRRNAKAATDRL